MCYILKEGFYFVCLFIYLFVQVQQESSKAEAFRLIL